MSAEPQLTKLPSAINCPICKAPQAGAMSMVGHKQPRIRKGTVMVCSACATINVFGDSDLRPMTPQEFNRLDERSKSSIAVIRQQLQARLQNGEPWNPKADGSKLG